MEVDTAHVDDAVDIARKTAAFDSSLSDMDYLRSKMRLEEGASSSQASSDGNDDKTKEKIKKKDRKSKTKSESTESGGKGDATHGDEGAAVDSVKE